MPADQIPPHPTGVKRCIIVEDGINQEGPTLLRGRVRGVFDHRDATRAVHMSVLMASSEPNVASYDAFTKRSTTG